jgi:hypothetical protein
VEDPSKLVMRVRFPSPAPAAQKNISNIFQDTLLGRVPVAGRSDLGIRHTGGRNAGVAAVLPFLGRAYR